MMPAKELIAEVRVRAIGMDLSTRFLVLDMCDRFARQIRDNELLVKQVCATIPVRCKECKHWKDGVSGCTDHVKCCDIGFYMVGENGDCVYGERKEDTGA